MNWREFFGKISNNDVKEIAKLMAGRLEYVFEMDESQAYYMAMNLIMDVRDQVRDSGIDEGS